MGSLKADVLRLEADLNGSAASRFSLENDTVSFSVCKPDGGMSRIGVAYLNARAYPKSSIALIADNNDPEQPALAQLSERCFQNSAPIERVVSEVLKVFGLGDGIPADEDECMEEDDDGRSCENDYDDSMDHDGSDDAGAASDGDVQEEEEEEEEEEEDRELMIACGQRQGRWERWEERYREEANAALQVFSHDEAAAKKQQIFNPREAFMMLSKELLDIIKKQSFDLFVDSVGDDVYTWNVELGSFDPKSNLYKDMQEIQRRHQFSFVKLIISFKRGLHPFYPPSVEVVRPHFQGVTATAIASHPLLKLGTWDPWRPVGELIGQIKTFLEAAARVDLDHPMNDIKRFPASSYRPVEVALARLNALSGLDLPCLDDPLLKELYASFSQDQARMEALHDVGKKRLRDAKQKEGKTVWAQGTGYGTGDRSNQDPVWDAAASEMAQRARDEELSLLLELLVTDVSCDLQLTDTGPLAMQLEGASSAAAAGPSSSSRTEPPPASVAGSSSSSLPPPLPKAPREVQNIEPDPASCLSILEASCLMDFITRELKVASFTDMCSRTPYYLAVLRLAHMLGRHGKACSLLWRQAPGSRLSVAGLLQSMLQPAQQYARVTQPIYDREIEERSQSAATVAAAVAAGAPPPAPLPPKIAAQQQETLNELLGGLRLAGLVKDVVALLPAGKLQRGPGGSSESGEGASGSGSRTAASEYCEVLRPLQVEYISDLRSMSHHYASAATSESVQPKARMSRLAREMAGLQQLLPLNECSSVFVRADENNVTLWRAVITGPEDTPYSAGCFVFDLYFPPNYPSVPPQVQFKTTGGGRIRFNPNLYNNGKVCLSLLGTWEGGKGEGWNPAASSALQVLLSIQSLILVPDPFFNEPGFEQRHSGDEGKKQSREYNKDITEGTIRYAMIDLLQHPPPELVGVIKAHFRLRRQVVLDTTQAWVDAAGAWNPRHAASLKALRDQLVPLLEKL